MIVIPKEVVSFREYVLDLRPVGSRVTCNPTPENTDADYLILLSPKSSFFFQKLEEEGYIQDGSVIQDVVNKIPPEDRFYSFSKKPINIIATKSPKFFFRFMAATHVATQLNLLDKEQRIMLFQAVLYGNQYKTSVKTEFDMQHQA